jgi:hypothetical protein
MPDRTISRGLRVEGRVRLPEFFRLSQLGKIKGVAFGEFLTWYDRTYPNGTVASAVREVEARFDDGLDAERAGFGVLASRWYAAELVHDLLDRLTSGRSVGELDRMALDAANFIMGRTIKGVYRTMFSMFVTPERYVKYIGKLWAMHYDTGELVVRAQEPNVHRVTYSEWAGHHPFICRMNMASGYSIYSAMGCKDVTCQRMRCVSDGAADCESMVRWVK